MMHYCTSLLCAVFFLALLLPSQKSSLCEYNAQVEFNSNSTTACSTVMLWEGAVDAAE